MSGICNRQALLLPWSPHSHMREEPKGWGNPTLCDQQPGRLRRPSSFSRK